MLATPCLSPPALHVQYVLFLSHQAKDRERMLRESLQAVGNWRVVNVSEKFAFVKQLISNPPDLVVADATTPCFHSLEALQMVKYIHPDCRFYLLLDQGEDELLLDAILQGADACFFRNQWSTMREIIDSPNIGSTDHEMIDMKQRIIRKIEENIDGLGEIKEFLSEMSETAGRFPEKVDEEIDESIDYLKKLERKLKAKSK
ncbi:MAG: hypothetical protein AAF206_11700 [Bacteroidota bacterium]